MFGTSPEMCTRLWQMIDPFVSMPNGVHPRHLLWALMLLKLYCAESVLCTLAGGENGRAPDEKTFRKWCWLFVEAISDLQFSVVSAKSRVQVLASFLFLIIVNLSFSPVSRSYGQTVSVATLAMCARFLLMQRTFVSTNGNHFGLGGFHTKPRVPDFDGRSL
jgi:hypothetical protein